MSGSGTGVPAVGASSNIVGLVTPPSAEPLTVAEVRTHLRIGSGNLEPAPGTAPTCALAGAGAGNVDNGAHRYAVVFKTADGHTEVGPISSVVTVVDKTANGKAALTAIPLGGSAVTARDLYRTIAGGSALLFLATIADNSTTTYTDNIADASLGAGAPTVNTTTDPQFNRWIMSARLQAESYQRRAFITQQWKLTLDRFPNNGWLGYAIWGALGGHGSQYPGYLGPQTIPVSIRDQILVPLPPLQTVDSIRYVDQGGTWQTLASDQYIVDANSEPGRITPIPFTWWPPTQPRIAAVEVTFTAGYGNSASAVPADIRDWMLLRIGAMYENREEELVGARLTQVSLGFADELRNRDRLYSL